MLRKIGMISIPGAALLSGSLLFLLGCQEESVSSRESANDRQYALEVQKLKAGPVAALESGLAALDRKFGFPANAPVTASPAQGTALEKAANTQVFNSSGNCSRISKFVFKADPGDRVVFRANSINANNTGYSDPVALLIQFNDANFIENGVVPNASQADFRILARNDDVSMGNMSSAIDYTFKAGESGNFMLMAYPYANASSTRYVDLSLDLYRQACPSCDYIVPDPIRTLGGLVFFYSDQGANDFRASRSTTDAGDPHLYVIKNSGGSGMSNGNYNLSQNARVYPYPVTAFEGSIDGNIVLIDNDVSGTAPFKLTQYIP